MVPGIVPRGPAYASVDDKQKQEARNGVLQAAYLLDRIDDVAMAREVNIALLCELQRRAIANIYRYAGVLRDGPVGLLNSAHAPPPHGEVPSLVQEWNRAAPLGLAAYLMWRVNWIHPFFGGNGRTSRAIPYLVLCAKLGYRLPGRKLIPELIAVNRDEYFASLPDADAAQAVGIIDVSRMERFLEGMLALQLPSVLDQAAGRTDHR